MITKDTLIKMSKDIDAALAAVGTKYNVTIRAGNSTYDPEAGTATCKLEVVALAADGTVRDMDAEAFRREASLLGLRPDDLGKPIRLSGKTFTVSGYRPKARKNPITIKDADGKVFVTSIDTVRRQLQKSA